MFVLVGFLAAASWASPAVAQTQMTTGPMVNLWYGGLVTGVETVKNTGAVIGAEAGARVWRHLDVSLEAGSFGDVVPQTEIDSAAPLSDFLQQTQGQAAALTLKRPAIYGGLGARWVFEDTILAGRARPYVNFGLGGARVKHEPTFTLGGTDVTGALDQYRRQAGRRFDRHREEGGDHRRRRRPDPGAQLLSRPRLPADEHPDRRHDQRQSVQYRRRRAVLTAPSARIAIAG